MRDAVIVEALRTPVGKNAGGLAGVHPAALSATVLNALVAKAGVDPALVDDVIWGCVSQVGDAENGQRRAVRRTPGRLARRGCRPRPSTASAGRPSRRCTSPHPDYSGGPTSPWLEVSRSCRGWGSARRHHGGPPFGATVRARYRGAASTRGSPLRSSRRVAALTASWTSTRCGPSEGAAASDAAPSIAPIVLVTTAEDRLAPTRRYAGAPAWTSSPAEARLRGGRRCPRRPPLPDQRRRGGGDGDDLGARRGLGLVPWPASTPPGSLGTTRS